MLSNISQYYVYLQDKEVDLGCIREYYGRELERISSEEETVLFFEYVLNEFYDNHLTLGTNRDSSYRLFAPLYASLQGDQIIIKNVWQTQIEAPEVNIIGAEIMSFNGTEFNEVIARFPSQCNDKSNPEVREWIINKILSGRYSEPRVLGLRLAGGQELEFDLDAITLSPNDGLLTSRKIGNIGLIRINNSLGNDDLVSAFDSTLNEFSDADGIIIDLRNTIFGGDSYEARGIMSRFIDAPQPYQKHAYIAKSPGNPDVERSWVEYVSPRPEPYEKPVVVLVGRWTGSMGEGLAIGFEGMGRAEIVGTEMRRLAGEVYDFGFQHQWYGYKLSTARLFHVNGRPREAYVPENYVEQRTMETDEVLQRGLEIIHGLNER